MSQTFTEIMMMSEQPTEALPDTPVEWAPAPKRRRRRWPWIVAPLAVAAIGATVVSTLLIAPGVQAAGVSVGGLTRDAAVKAITEKVAAATVTFDTADGPVSLTGAQLGATVDAAALADKAHGDHPLWKVGSWGENTVPGTVAIDDAKAAAAVRENVPGSFVDPVEATVKFDGKNYVTSESKNGTGIPVDAIREALQKALSTEKDSAAVSGEPESVEPILTTAEAKKAADKLNATVSNVGFYVGEDNAVPVDAKTAASWIDYKIADDGAVAITAKEAEIAKIVPTIAEKVNRPAVAGKVTVDTGGDVLQTEEEPVDGRKVGDTAGIAKAFAAQLAQGKTKYELPVEVDKATVTRTEKRIEVNLSTQMTYAYENGEVVRSMSISSGLPGAATETHTGNFRINSHVAMQDMGCNDNYSYCTKDVPTVMYFNGDEAFHGTYWHNNFGTPMSHGCVNMTLGDAEWLYWWTPVGTEVSVHY